MKKIRALIVEDNVDHQRLLLLALAAGGPAVETLVVTGVSEAIEAARAGSINCVVMDYHLPPFTALDLIRTLRPLLPQAPFVVISANEEQRIAIASLQRGAADFVPKDAAMTGDALWRHIRTAVESARRANVERRLSSRRLVSLRHLADTDPLTGLHTRGYAERALRSERARADRRLQTSCVMFDVDHFKQINDRWGHAAGDDALRAVAQTLRAECGPTDVAVRWGGEEFLVFKPSCTESEAWQWADGVRRRIESQAIQCGSEVIHLTTSAGVATAPTATLSERDVTLADRALYLAKDGGRNRTCSWAMCRAIDTALDIESRPGMTDGEKVAELLRRLDEWLGPTQREHIGAHGMRVRDVAMSIGRLMGVTGADLATLESAALHHDIGKIALPEAMLARAGPLAPRERWLVDEHARFGAETIRALGLPGRIGDVIEAHHARFDKAGASAAPPGSTMGLARILSVADAFAAMMGGRPYAARRTINQTMAALRLERGGQFEPGVVDSVQSLEPALLAAA